MLLGSERGGQWAEDGMSDIELPHLTSSWNTVFSCSTMQLKVQACNVPLVSFILMDDQVPRESLKHFMVTIFRFK